MFFPSKVCRLKPNNRLTETQVNGANFSMKGIFIYTSPDMNSWSYHHLQWFSPQNYRRNTVLQKETYRTSLVAQWLRIHLPMQGTQVRALAREDPTCHGATKPVCHNYWACALEPMSHNYWARVPQLLKPVRLEPVLRNKRSHHKRRPLTTTKSRPRSPQVEKAPTQQRRPNAAKNK